MRTLQFMHEVSEMRYIAPRALPTGRHAAKFVAKAGGMPVTLTLFFKAQYAEAIQRELARYAREYEDPPAVGLVDLSYHNVSDVAFVWKDASYDLVIDHENGNHQETWAIYPEKEAADAA